MNCDVRSFILIALISIYRKFIRGATLKNYDVRSFIWIVFYQSILKVD